MQRLEFELAAAHRLSGGGAGQLLSIINDLA